ncbi:hypothetical protein NBRC116596_24830 [Litorivita sp. NS0012-18]
MAAAQDKSGRRAPQGRGSGIKGRAGNRRSGAGWRVSRPKRAQANACNAKLAINTPMRSLLHRETGRQGDRETGRQGDRETGRQGDRETGRQGDRETGRQGDREIGR